jgi:hypothetical protein
MKRNWKISIAGISPVRKTGGTKLDNGELIAHDRMKIKVFSKLRLRWKTVLTSQSRASHYGYHPPKNLTTLLKDEKEPSISLGIAVQLDLPELSMGLTPDKKKLTAITAATLIYRRESRPYEVLNVFNPFWTTSLIPVADETTLKKIVPEFILREVRH